PSRCQHRGHKGSWFGLRRLPPDHSVRHALKRSWIATGTPCSGEEARRRPAAGSDRFGLGWQIVPAILDELMRDKDRARSKRVTDALLRMVKLDIAALEKAYRGS